LPSILVVNQANNWLSQLSAEIYWPNCLTTSAYGESAP